MKESFVLQILIRVATFMSVLGWVWGTPVSREAAVLSPMEKAGFGGDRLSSEAQENTSSEGLASGMRKNCKF